MDSITLELAAREVTGKAVKHLRVDGLVPAVIHDHGKDSINVQAVYTDLHKVWLMAGKHHPVDITAGDKHYTALIKDIAFSPRKHQITHVVFNAVDKNQKVEAAIPVRPKYAEGNDSSPAERAGLIVLAQLEEVAVKAVADKLPDFLEYDAEKLIGIGDHVTAADLIVPTGVEIDIEADHVLATVFEPSALAAANDAVGGDAEPEDTTDEADEPTEVTDAKSE